MADSTGMADIRGLQISKAITGFALQEYVFKELCFQSTSSAWQNRYFKETAADLSGQLHHEVEGVPRLANFPHGEVTWTQVNGYMKKFGMEGVISWEDSVSNDIDTIQRTLLRIARSVTKAVDSEIWDVLTEGRVVSTINSVTIPAGYEFDSATLSNQDPIKYILKAKQAIYENNYNPDQGGFLLLSPKDYTNILSNANVRNAGQFYTKDVTKNGNVGFLLGLKVKVSTNVTADYAAVVVGNEAATWLSLSPLNTVTIVDEGIGYTIRSWETGMCELKNPQAVCLIINTAA